MIPGPVPADRVERGYSLDMADYDVVLLVEQALSGADALRVRSLHEGLDDPVTYHVLMPVEDAAARVEAALTALPTTEYAGTMALTRAPIDLDAVQADELAVVDHDGVVLGTLSEKFVRKRYAEELEKSQRELFEE